MNSDLDNLKNGWKAFKEISENNEIRSKSQLQEILKKDSKQIGYRFRRMLWIETALSILFTISLLVFAFNNEGIAQAIWIAMTLVYIATFVWLATNLYQFPTQNNIDSSLHNALEQQTKIAERFISVYIKSNTILAFPCTFAGFFAGIQVGRDESLTVYFGEMIQNEHYLKLFILTSSALFVSVLVTYLIKKNIHLYINKTYGKYLEELNTLKAQLTE